MAGPDIWSSLGLSSSYANQQNKKALAAQQAANQQAATQARQGYTAGTGAIQTGIGQATGALAPAIQNASQFVNQQNTGYQLFADAMGLNGPAGTARASAAYSGSLQPGLNMATQTINRNNAATGSLRSGQNLADIADYEFNTQYNPWRQMLGTSFNPLSGIQEQGQLGGAQADIYTGGAQSLAGLDVGKANALANLSLGAGTNLANYYNTNAANVGTTGSNILGLAGNILGAGATLAGLKRPTALPSASSGYAPGSTPVSGASPGQFSWFTGQ